MKDAGKNQVAATERPMVLSAGQLADKLGVSLRHVRRMDSAGMLPTPVRFGRSVRWPVDELRAWLKAGAPDRGTWQQIKDRQLQLHGLGGGS